MKSFIKKIAVAAIVVVGAIGLFSVITDASVFADSPKGKICEGVNAALGGDDCSSTSTTVLSVWPIAKTIINWLLIAAGIVAVGFIIWSGIRYILSSGDPEKVKKAKATILYAIIGLIIASMAAIIVNLVLNIGETVSDGASTKPAASSYKNQADCEGAGHKWTVATNTCG